MTPARLWGTYGEDGEPSYDLRSLMDRVATSVGTMSRAPSRRRQATSAPSDRRRHARSNIGPASMECRQEFFQWLRLAMGARGMIQILPLPLLGPCPPADGIGNRRRSATELSTTQSRRVNSGD